MNKNEAILYYENFHGKEIRIKDEWYVFFKGRAYDFINEDHYIELRISEKPGQRPLHPIHMLSSSDFFAYFVQGEKKQLDKHAMYELCNDLRENQLEKKSESIILDSSRYSGKGGPFGTYEASGIGPNYLPYRAECYSTKRAQGYKICLFAGISDISAPPYHFEIKKPD